MDKKPAIYVNNEDFKAERIGVLSDKDKLAVVEKMEVYAYDISKNTVFSSKTEKK